MALDRRLLAETVGSAAAANLCACGDSTDVPEASLFVGDAGPTGAGAISTSAGAAWPSGMPETGDAVPLGRTRTIRIGYGLIASAGAALTPSGFELRPATPAANASGAGDFSCAFLETRSVS